MSRKEPFTDLAQCKIYLRSVALSSPEPVPIYRLINDFEELTKRSINPMLFGFADIPSFLISIPDVVKLHGFGGSALVEGVTSAASAGIRSMIDRQKPKKKRNKPLKIAVGRFSRGPYNNPPPRPAFHSRYSAPIPPRVTRSSIPPRPNMQSNNSASGSSRQSYIMPQQDRFSGIKPLLSQSTSFNSSRQSSYQDCSRQSNYNQDCSRQSSYQDEWGTDEWNAEFEDFEGDSTLNSPSPAVRSVVVVPQHSTLSSEHLHSDKPVIQKTEVISVNTNNGWNNCITQPNTASSTTSYRSQKSDPRRHSDVSFDQTKLSNGALNMLTRTMASIKSHNNKNKKVYNDCQVIMVDDPQTQTPKMSFKSIIKVEPPKKTPIVLDTVSTEEMLNVIANSLLNGQLTEKLLLQKLGLVFHRYAHVCFMMCCIQLTAICQDAFVVENKPDENDVFSIKNLEEVPVSQEFDETILEAVQKMRQIKGLLVSTYKTCLVFVFSSNEELGPYLLKMDKEIEKSFKKTFLSLYRENELCAVKLEAGPALILTDNKTQTFQWYRAQLLSCEMDGFHRSCTVFLLDFGVEMYVERAVLRPLPENFRSHYRVHLVDLEGVIVDSSPDVFAQKMSPYIDHEMRVRPSECLRKSQSCNNIERQQGNVTNVTICEVQYENKLLSDELIDLKICRRGREWARDFIFPYRHSIPVKVLNFDMLPVVPVLLNIAENNSALQSLGTLLFEKSKVPIARLSTLCANEVCVWKSNNIGHRVKIVSLRVDKAHVNFLDKYEFKEVPVNELFVLPRVEETTLPYQVTFIHLYMLENPPRSSNLSVFLSAPYLAYKIDGKFVLQNDHTQAYLNLDLINIALGEIKVPEISHPVSFLGVTDNKILCFKYTNCAKQIDVRIKMARWLLNQLISNQSSEKPELELISSDNPPRSNEILICRIEPAVNSAVVQDLALLNDVCDRVMIVAGKLCCLDRAVPQLDIPDNYSGLYRVPITTSLEEDSELRFLVACAKYLPPSVERATIINSVDTELLQPPQTGHVNFVSKGGDGNFAAVEAIVGQNNASYFATMTPPASNNDVEYLEIDVITPGVAAMSLSLTDNGYTAPTVYVETEN